MYQIVDRETLEVVDCEPDAPCQDNCIVVLPGGSDPPGTPDIPPDGYAFVYTNYMAKVYVDDSPNPPIVLLVLAESLFD